MDSTDDRWTEIAGDIAKDTTLTADRDYLLVGQVFVRAGATLTLEPGTTVHALPYDAVGLASVLVVEPGARIIADGTASEPITFTTALSDQDLPARGLWGGLVLLGNAPVNQTGGTAFVEGLAGAPFGGTRVDDSSGVLRYVRVWYSGRVVGVDNELNGITLGGVGRGTTLEHCEVAWSADDGFEFFGGTVDARYLSVLFAGDDAFDMDWGYQGRAQHLFALLGQDRSGRGFEMDNDGDNVDAQPRTFPQISNVTMVGPGGGTPDGDGADAMIVLREGSGGDFRNMVVVRGNGFGVSIADEDTRALLTSAPPSMGSRDILYVSPETVAHGNPDGAVHTESQGALSITDTDPLLTELDTTPPPQGGAGFDPRPRAASPLLNAAEAPRDDAFFELTDHAGAFAEDDLWLRGWSWLSSANILREE